MVEFTDREKKIIHAMNVMNNPAYNEAPFDLKTKALQSVLLVAGYTWNEDEMTDIMQAIGKECEDANKAGLKMLDKYKHLFKGLGKL